MKKSDFETIFNYNNATNIQYGIVKIFGSRERAYSMGVNAHFGPIWTNRLHATSNYEPEKSKFKVDYHINKYCY